MRAVNKFLKFLKKNNLIILMGIIIITINHFSLGKLIFDYNKNYISENGYIALAVFEIFEILELILVNVLLKKKVAIEKLFLSLAIPIGMGYLVLVPLGRVPDEQNHFLRAYEISLGYLVSDKNVAGSGGREVSKDLLEIFDNNNRYSKEIKVMNNQKSEEVVFAPFPNTSLYSFVSYIPQTIGIFIGRSLNLTAFFTAYLGRIVTFSFWTFVMFMAIKLIPFKKISILTLAFMPMMLQEAASLSPDAIINSVGFLLFAYVLYLKYNYKEKISWKNKTILSILCIIISLCKIVYLPICLLMFMIPTKKFESKRDKYTFIGILAFCVVLFNLTWLKISSSYLIEIREGVNSSLQLKYILTQPMTFLHTIFNTIYDYATFYLFNIIGASLCNFDVNISYLYVFIYIFLLATIFILDYTDKIDKKTKYLPAFIIFSVIILIFTSLYIQWNQVYNIFVDGVQGRYFIPLMLLVCYIINIPIKSLNNIDKYQITTVTSNLIVFVNIYVMMVMYFYHIA